VLGTALARAGFAVLMYWSPAMRDFRLDPEDVRNIPLAYNWLIEQPHIDGARSGMLGTCVGGSFALMSAASPLIRNRIAFVSAYAPYSSLWTFARDVASGTRSSELGREPWEVDPLTYKVFVHSMTTLLEPAEAAWFREAFVKRGATPAGHDLSADGRAVYSLLTARDENEAEYALKNLPAILQEQLSALSPMNYLKDIRAPLMVLLHDRGDQVIPVGESRRFYSALDGRGGVHYTEMQFQHLDPVKARLPLLRLARELGRFFRAVYPLFEQAEPS
jgi:dipeptidyl aminopeptidase/acylaminoacyl peptidase